MVSPAGFTFKIDPKIIAKKINVGTDILLSLKETTGHRRQQQLWYREFRSLKGMK